jgi:hypothetical protein
MRAEFALLLGAILAGPAFAQVSPGAPGSRNTIPEKDPTLGSSKSDGYDVTTGRSGSLSDRLDASGGILKPAPGVDPDMVKPAPAPGPNSTPVIPPSGLPGDAPTPK